MNDLIVQFQDEVMEMRLLFYLRHTLYWLADGIISEAGQPLEFWYSTAAMASWAQVSKPTMKRYLRKFVELGIFEVVSGPNSEHRAVTYRFNLDLLRAQFSERRSPESREQRIEASLQKARAEAREAYKIKRDREKRREPIKLLADLPHIHQRIAEDMTADQPFLLKCSTCKVWRGITTDEFAAYLAHGWPYCCGNTMQLEKAA